MMEPVMAMTEREKMAGVGPPAVLPMNDVMHLKPPAAVTSRHPATPISFFDHDPAALRHRAQRPPHAHRLAGSLEDRPHPGVAAEEPADTVVQPRAEVQVPAGTRL